MSEVDRDIVVVGGARSAGAALSLLHRRGLLVGFSAIGGAATADARPEKNRATASRCESDGAVSRQVRRAWERELQKRGSRAMKERRR